MSNWLEKLDAVVRKIKEEKDADAQRIATAQATMRNRELQRRVEEARKRAEERAYNENMGIELSEGLAFAEADEHLQGIKRRIWKGGTISPVSWIETSLQAGLVGISLVQVGKREYTKYYDCEQVRAITIGAARFYGDGPDVLFTTTIYPVRIESANGINQLGNTKSKETTEALETNILELAQLDWQRHVTRDIRRGTVKDTGY